MQIDLVIIWKAGKPEKTYFETYDHHNEYLSEEFLYIMMHSLFLQSEKNILQIAYLEFYESSCSIIYALIGTNWFREMIT